MNIAIVIPSNDMVHADFTFSLIHMIEFTHNHLKDVGLAIINPRSSLVQKGRWQGVNQAIAMKADKVLFIDSDQTFLHNALIRLLGHKDLAIIGASSVTRRPPIEFTARDEGGDRIDIASRRGLLKVASNGFAFCLIDMCVFKAIPAHKWFNVVQQADGHWWSEDESFCLQARGAGFDTWVDADLSQEVGHIGQKCYTVDDV